tara:strand:- start:97 stop:198 length:102 start_codon:yes stop_codon:yes gene_type:complete
MLWGETGPSGKLAGIYKFGVLWWKMDVAWAKAA